MRLAVYRARVVAVVVATLGVLLAVPSAFAVGQEPAGHEPSGHGVEQPCPTPDPATPKRQMRAVWIASVVNIDWPSRTGLPVEQQQAEYRRWLDDAQRYKFNTVVVQVRPTADAFWPSNFEPWSEWITGVPGRDPGYDPLEFAVREAHARNLEFHAWFNPYRVAMHGDPNRLAPNHPARLHPEWIVTYGGRLYYNPGIPEVRQFVQNAIMDAVERYDIDGVHFDDYFYPYPVGTQQFNDEASYQQYGAGFARKADWRRDNVNKLIQELDQRIHAAKPWVKFGVSPFAVWRNIATDPQGSDTRAGVQTYDDLYADTRHWVRQQWIDYVVPQVYWNIGFTVADYAKIVPWWSREVDGTDVHLYIGQATYKVGTLPTQHPAWLQPEEMPRHLTFNRDYPQVLGDVYFSANQVRANRLGHMDLILAQHYQRPALLPLAPQLGGEAPRQPALASTDRSDGGITVNWVDTSDPHQRATAFAVYRFDGDTDVRACDLVDASHLLTAVRSTGDRKQSFTDTTAEPGRTYTYVLTALDRLHHESGPSQERVVR